MLKSLTFFFKKDISIHIIFVAFTRASEPVLLHEVVRGACKAPVEGDLTGGTRGTAVVAVDS